MPGHRLNPGGYRRSRQLAVVGLVIAWIAVLLMGLGQPHQAKPADPAASAKFRINVNQADAATLQLLPNVGPALASNIIAYRQRHGPFESVAELERVSKIGPTIRERIAPWVVLLDEGGKTRATASEP